MVMRPGLAAVIAMAAPFTSGAPALDTGRRRDPTEDLVVPTWDDASYHRDPGGRHGGMGDLVLLLRDNPYRDADSIIGTARARARSEQYDRAVAKRERKAAKRLREARALSGGAS